MTAGQRHIFDRSFLGTFLVILEQLQNRENRKILAKFDGFHINNTYKKKSRQFINKRKVSKTFLREQFIGLGLCHDMISAFFSKIYLGH